MCLLCLSFSNILICCRAAEKALYTKTYLPIDESTLENDTWFNHPTLPVKVNEDGTHIFDRTNHKFKPIRRYAWKTCDWVTVRVSIIGTDKIFSRVALECFIGRELLPGETCEHIDCVRDNNSESNLLPRFQLFQANARKIHKFVVDGKCTGVRPMGDGQRKYFQVRVRLYTPDSYKISLTLEKYFHRSQYGSIDAAEQEAIAFRKKHTLREGMVWV